MENVRLRHQNMDIAAIAACHKDTIRIKEQMTLSGSKPNIGQLLWKEMRLCGISARPSEAWKYLLFTPARETTHQFNGGKKPSRFQGK